MADPNELKEEAVHIKPPLPTAGEAPDMKMRETVQMPLRDDRAAASNQSFRPANPSDSVPLEPKKETMRISLEAAPSPGGTQIKDPQLFVPSPDLARENPLVPIAPVKKNPMLLWWLLLGVSALILIIQIWTYVS